MTKESFKSWYGWEKKGWYGWQFNKIALTDIKMSTHPKELFFICVLPIDVYHNSTKF